MQRRGARARQRVALQNRADARPVRLQCFAPIQLHDLGQLLDGDAGVRDAGFDEGGAVRDRHPTTCRSCLMMSVGVANIASISSSKLGVGVLGSGVMKSGM